MIHDRVLRAAKVGIVRYDWNKYLYKYKK
jgi:hypothetical protein